MLAKAFEAIGIALPRELQIAGKAVLKRSLLGVSGPEAGKFLNGLTTNRILDGPGADTQSLPVSSGQYTAFLSPQGRLMYDAFLFRKERNEYLVDCDERIGTDLLFHLQSHKLRAKIKLEDMSNEYKVETWWNLPSLLNGPKMTITDPRGSLGLLRSVSLKNEAEIVTEDPNAKWYDLLRYAAGIAEGPLEMRRVQSIPLECNLDWLEAVVFDKGCYVGQELMARTHFRGIIRKRIMPFKIPSDAGEAGGAPFKVKVDGGVEGIPSGGELFSVEPPDAKSMTEVHRMEMDAQPVGKVIGTLGNLGMALVRLPSWTEGHRFAVHRPTPSAGSCDQRQFVLVEPYKPHWWPPLNPAELL